MQDNLFRCVEREFYSYTENCRYLESLELRKQCIPAFRSSSDFSERVDTGTNYSDPVSIGMPLDRALDAIWREIRGQAEKYPEYAQINA